MNSLSRILLLAVAVLVPSLWAGPAHAAKKMEVIVQDDAVFLHQYYYDRERAFKQLRDLGASRLRMNLLWWQAMPEAQAMSKTKPGTINYDWSRFDGAIARAKAYGIKVQLDLTGEPPVWACGSKKPPGICDGYKPNVKEFGKFALAAAKHFGRAVDRYSIWNEPNWYAWLSPPSQVPTLYRALYKAGYAGVKKGNRNAQVLMGETAPQYQKCCAMAPLQFLREVFCVNKKFKRIAGGRNCKGGPLKSDGYAHHPYDFTEAPTSRRSNRDDLTMSNLGSLTATLDRLTRMGLLRGSKKKLPVYLTEYGYFVRGARRLPEAKRAKYIVKGYDIAQRNPRVLAQTYYVFVSPPADNPSSFFDLGLIETGGTPRAGYNKLRSWVNAAAKRGKVAKPGSCSAAVRANC
jgi:hypothetical protein